MAAELADLGLTARLVEGRAAGAALEGAELALIGADAVTPDLLINGTPSQSLAEAAAGRVPFYAVCETVKFTRDARADRGYDLVPLALVTAIATEEGVLAPDDVRRRIQEGGRAGPGHNWSSSHTALRRPGAAYDSRA